MKIGEGTKIASNLISAESYLITIGKNVTISHGVDFITHDNCVSKMFGVHNDLYGQIVIGDNCFIGAHAIVLYGVHIANNVIVAAGSVVTRSIEQENVIVGGNPARVIGNWNTFKQKTEHHVICTKGMTQEEKEECLMKNKNKFIKR